MDIPGTLVHVALDERDRHTGRCHARHSLAQRFGRDGISLAVDVPIEWMLYVEREERRALVNPPITLCPGEAWACEQVDVDSAVPLALHGGRELPRVVPDEAVLLERVLLDLQRCESVVHDFHQLQHGRCSSLGSWRRHLRARRRRVAHEPRTPLDALRDRRG